MNQKLFLLNHCLCHRTGLMFNILIPNIICLKYHLLKLHNWARQLRQYKWSGLVSGTEITCDFYYQLNSFSCLRNCSSSAIAYSNRFTRLLTGSTTDCTCQTKFAWNVTVVQCGSLTDNTELVSGSIGKCVCRSGFYWPPSDLKCIRNCSLIQYATGLQSSSWQV